MIDTLVGETRKLSSRPRYVRSVLLLRFSGTFHHIQLPDVLAAIRNLQTIDFDVDEYDIKGRLTCLIDRWGVTCPFLEQSRHQGQVTRVRIHSICGIFVLK